EGELGAEREIDEVGAVELEAVALDRVDEVVLRLDGRDAAGAPFERRLTRALDVPHDLDRVVEPVARVPAEDEGLGAVQLAEVEAEVGAEAEARARADEAHVAETVEERDAHVAAEGDEGLGLPDTLHAEERVTEHLEERRVPGHVGGGPGAHAREDLELLDGRVRDREHALRMAGVVSIREEA